MSDQLAPQEIIFKALDVIENYSIQALKSNGQQFEWAYMLPEAVDWQKFRASALHDLEPLKKVTLTDAAGIIDRSLMRLQDGHSLLMSPYYVRTVAAPYVDRITWVSHKEHFHKRPETNGVAYVMSMPEVVLKGDILHVIMPGFHFSSNTEARLKYQNLLRVGLMEASRQKLQGVVLDLRPNDGGSVTPMIAGLSPLLGPDVLGSYRGPGKSSHGSWGVNYCTPLDEQIALTDATQFPLIDTPVAVLSGAETCSSGEIVFLSFRGRSHTQSFGSPTGGNSSGNLPISLTPGGTIVMQLCTGVALDRNGHGSGNGVERLDGGKIQPDLATDFPLEHAVQWLEDGAPPFRCATTTSSYRPKPVLGL